LDSVVVSVRIPKELKERLERLNVNVSMVVRELLEKYVEEAELEKVKLRLKRIRQRLAGRVDASIIATLVREDRVRR